MTHCRNAAQRRYIRRFLPAMGVYSATVVLAGSWIGRHHPQGPTLWLLSLAPSVPLLVAIAAIGLYLAEETDEYVRSHAVTASIGATGLVLATGTIWGFLEQSGAVPHVPAWIVFPLWAVGLGLSQIALALRDRIAGAAA